MHEISQKLAVATKPNSWEPVGHGWTETDLTELRRDAVEEMLATKTGQALLERGGPEITDRILEVFAERYDGKTPSDSPFFEYLMEVAQDLLAELPEPVVPAAPIPKPKAPVITPEAKAKAEADAKATADRIGKVKQFAHLYNDALLNHGIASLKSRNGFVTVRVGSGEHAKAYEYPADEATQLLEEAISLGLIR